MSVHNKFLAKIYQQLSITDAWIVNTLFVTFDVNFLLNANFAYFAYSHESRGLTREHWLTDTLFEVKSTLSVCFQLSENTVYDILWYADLYMLPGLKRQCSNCIGKYINSDNVLQVLRSARLFNQARLEDQCSEFIANNLVNVSSMAVEISCIGIFGTCYFCPFTLSNGFVPSWICPGTVALKKK